MRFYWMILSAFMDHPEGWNLETADGLAAEQLGFAGLFIALADREVVGFLGD